MARFYLLVALLFLGLGLNDLVNGRLVEAGTWLSLAGANAAYSWGHHAYGRAPALSTVAGKAGAVAVALAIFFLVADALGLFRGA